MEGISPTMLRYIFTLLLITQISSADYGRKNPSSGRGPGPGPGGGKTLQAGQPLLPVRTSLPVTLAPGSTNARQLKSMANVTTSTRSTSRPRTEVFFLHLDDGYFGCQVNESTDVLQLYDVSKLCDGISDCYLGSDENRGKLKCTGDCVLTEGARCQNGACLDHECHCNDGYGGCGCSTPDENECKYRPCDVFAQCTNTLGSFTCTCYPGYEGDGFTCTDIDECKNPELAAKCVENAECCNLPAHYSCKCKPGFQGDGEKQCLDIDECQNPGSCGLNALCKNTPGNFTCTCPNGYGGNPYDGCADIDECKLANACGSGSICTNTDGGFQCTCPPGFGGDPKIACVDIDECAPPTSGAKVAPVCGRSAICDNLPGTFRCQCPPGFKGDPKVACEDINECLSNPCGANATCTDTVGSYSCSCAEDYTGDPYRGCVDIDECAVLSSPCGKQAICVNSVPGYNCLCPQGYAAQPTPDIACEQVDVATDCKGNFDCVNNAECLDGQCFCRDGFKPSGATCVDIDECFKAPCGPNSVCTNLPGSHRCECEAGFVGKPPSTPCKAPCEDVKCGTHATCKTQGEEAFCVCDQGWTYDPANIAAGCQDIDECDLAQGSLSRCGEGAICSNTPGSFNCACPPGFTGDPSTRCLDIDECQRQGVCGTGAICVNLAGSHECRCPNGTAPEPDARTKCVSLLRCAIDDDCPGNAVCDPTKECLCPEPNTGKDCRHPCETVRCSANQECMLINDVAKCMCSSGFTGGPNGGCVDIDECATGQQPCAQSAVCRNEPGRFVCECPSGFEGEPYKKGCIEKATAPPGCSAKNPCPSGEVCVPSDSKTASGGVCVCSRGWIRDQATGLCRDVNECLESPADKPACGFRAVCKNLPGSYDCSCPEGHEGNPFQRCDVCDSIQCRCQPPYRVVGGACLLADCAGGKQVCPAGAECVSVTGGVSYCACPSGYRARPDGSCEDINECQEGVNGQSACGFGAECFNRPGRFDCQCPGNFTGDPYKGLCAPSQVRCVSDTECGTNERCVQPGECVCPPPYYFDTEDGNKCKSPCERHACGVNSKCTPSDPPKCMCEPGHTGNPTVGCSDIDECRDNPCGPGALCMNENGGFKCRCPTGLLGDAYQDGCRGEARSECQADDDCDGQLACIQGGCVNPCQALPCGANAYCEPEEHAAWCRCLPGFKEDSKTGACVSLCQNILCGENAQCVVSSATSLGGTSTTCSCLEGYNGNPFPGGSCAPDVCSAALPCQEPQVCVSGRCKERCEGVTCGVGARCDKTTNQCVCLPYFIGKPDLLCVPPVVPPVCQPPCGRNSHCEYGQPNRCVCNPGTSGNPYESCGAQEKTCDATKCGINAECRQGLNRVDCVCPVGYQGNPYVACEDINECVGNACGANAACLNTPGSYDCRCQEGFSGNPFMMCMPISLQPPVQPNVEDPCTRVTCGPNAACRNGQCICLPGYSSQAGGPCSVPSCRNDLDCASREVCLPLDQGVKNNGVRRCVDACSRDQCGPNAVCVADAHRASCICRNGFVGNPNDLAVGCQPEPAGDKCGKDDDCPGQAVCGKDIDGILQCVDPCKSFTCAQSESCVIKAGKAHCECLTNFVRNPATGSCEKPGLPDCVTNADCRSDSVCRPDVLGVRKCTAVCAGYTCSANSDCRATNHIGQCVCRPGFTGNPNDRNGCRPVPKDQCQTDAQCSEVESCKADVAGVRRCVAICPTVRCGSGAVCVANNHAAKCSCPTTGLYAGNPSGPEGCRKVECLANNDCPGTKSCDRNTYSCKPVCVQNSCGKNAICLAENHMAMCSCPVGLVPNPRPEIECTPADLCVSKPCHPSAICSTSAGRAVCSCPLDRIGDPYRTGCRANGTCPNGNGDCPLEAACSDGRCTNPCEGFCGPNALCRVVNHRPTCSCPSRFNPNPTPDRGCVRQPQSCRADSDCPTGSPCMGGQCKAVCRNGLDCAQGERCVSSVCQLPCVSHGQCSNGQACVGGYCRAGCRSSADCPINQACLNHQCENPCQREGVCGLNALCRVIDRSAQCACPDGFMGGPTAQQGCMRNPIYCQAGKVCPTGQSCQSGRCYPSCREGSNTCVGGERCLAGNCVKICYSDNNCMSGEVCIDGGCRPGCRADTDCSNSQVCRNSQCRCAPGYAPGPTGCVDVDECQSRPCHATAQCTNVPGSFRCSCRPGTVGDGYTEPCVAANQCETSAGCSDQLACLVRQGGSKACADPCTSTKCGPNAICTVVDHQASCTCPPATRGNPNDLRLGCFRVDCIENEDCPQDRTCDKQSFKCINPCDSIECYNGLCQVKNRKAVCQCAPGFRPTQDNKCIDVDECSTNPCHPTAICRNNPGNFQCLCPSGLVGEPYKVGCKRPGQCVADSDCPMTASCISGTCKDPCGVAGTCGKGSDCVAENHLPVCRCPFQSTGNPKIECYTLQCIDGSDCDQKEACVNNKCVDPCAASNSCGPNSDCSAVNHRAVCECKSGFTGSPYQGCVALVYCASEAQCPTSQTCAGGVCVSRCQSSRDCLPSQQCIDGKCRPACSDNSQCVGGQICANSVCVQEVRCRSDTECDDGQSCLKSSNGQAECRNPCDGAVLCGRNAVCKAVDRQAVCSCKEGFFGNPQDDKIGCLKIECTKNEDCSVDKRCHDNRCKIACMVENLCGKNTLCFSEKHQSVCKCQPGYTGNVLAGCTPIDYCSQKPCAAGARCENTRGSYKCICPTGTVGEPYGEGCQQPVECRQNSDCPQSAVCGREKGQPKCQDVCAGYSCGANADCLPANHKAACVCRQGYQGNPADKAVGCVRQPVSCKAQPDCPPNTFCYGGICKPACQSNAECQDSEACIRGQCVNPCQQDGFCGMNAQCQAKDHEAICSCAAGFTGTPKTECIRVPIACRRDGDCDSGNRCTEGRCIPLCTADSQCANNEKCVAGQCMLTCRVDNDCFLSHICLDNMCTIGCRQNSDCATDEACVNSRCKNPCTLDVCGPNALCNVVNQRAQCTCPAGFLAYPTANTACVREPTPCTGTKSCAAGFTCQNSVCRPLCSADSQCLVNERCNQGMCVPVCRQDTDCSSGEICSMGSCKVGCRTDPDCPMTHACLNAQCVAACASPAACGTNAKCQGVNHRAQCSCLEGLVGNAKVACRYPPSTCTASGECLANQKCIGGMCRPGCSNDQGCLSDSRCINGVCSPVCNSDSFCDRGHVCLDRVCVVGCRNDATCPANQACINNKCADPCRAPNVCGNCAVCEVINHAAQCTCPAGSIGNPQVGCSITPTRCAANGDCSSGSCNSGFCSKACTKNNNCSCGESCVQGRCRLKCSADNQCPTGQLCRIGSCAAGCRSNSDCAVEQACLNGQCKDPCQVSPCGRGAECRISDHRAVCLCPSGYAGNPSVSCEKNECERDDDCDSDKRCQNNRCVLPCLEPGACGVNANCRAVSHKAQCLCPPGYYGNAQVECKLDVNECLNNPCGANAICTDNVGSFTCTCEPGCMGDPVKGCLCTAPSTIDPCADSGCGTNAACRVEGTRPVCYCPANYPSGNPRVECTVERPSPDCRTEGCGEGASCVAQGNLYVCQCRTGLQGNPDVRCSADRSCSIDNDCPMDKACVQRQCQDPCSLREACGTNALCSVVLHKARCSCPQCYIGRPTDKCSPDPRCGTTTQRPVAVITTARNPIASSSPRPPTSPVVAACSRDNQCSTNQACNTNLAACQDPCDFKNVACDQGKRCEVRRHRPVCVCKHGFVLNEAGEMACGPNPIECRVDDECASNLACVAGRCQNPCAGTRNPCSSSNKVCQVLDHRAVCICVEDCVASVSICLRDRGCPANMACVNYQCRNPCENSTCPENRPCYVEEHKAVCKFCPPGFVVNPTYGCIQAVGCRTDSDCPSKEGCVNGRCQDPGLPKEPVVGECNPACKPNEECDATTLTCFPVVVGECQSNNDCPYDRYCDRPTAQCVPVCQTRVCGRLASCQAVNHNAVCSCLEGYSGNPREECYKLAGCRSNSDCPAKEACINGQCASPCRCGAGAVCEIRDHNAVCKCPAGTIGNPLSGCTSPVVSEPCNPSPCGPNSDCAVGPQQNAICTCRPGFFGNPQSNRGCGPECTTNSECPTTQACINQKCRDPCPGACGINAACRVSGHNPVCTCVPGYTGNPYQNCNPISVSPVVTPTLAPPISYPQQPQPPAQPRPECVLNSDCASTLACINQKCRDPCPGVCGQNAVCKVNNHNPICSCVQGYQGDPTRSCAPRPVEPVVVEPAVTQPCTPNPCGNYAECRPVNNQPICSCLPGYFGTPCRPECVASSDCPKNKACVNQKCVDPCPGTCGIGATCVVRDHNPICSCPNSMTGDPFVRCTEPVVVEPETSTTRPKDPCNPSPCGVGAECRQQGNRVACKCPPNYVGDPYSGCRPECVQNSDCPRDKSCANNRCVDPCPGVCGLNAECRVINHYPVCSCQSGYSGDATSACRPIPIEGRPMEPVVAERPCVPSPCGPNSACREVSNKPVCSCQPGYIGVPPSCRPECSSNSECSQSLACINQKCRDPCPGVCGENAVCRVNNHNPICSCEKDLTGDPFVRCQPFPVRPQEPVVSEPENPCVPSPCGPNSKCQVVNNRPLCGCQDGMIGTVPNCRPECVRNSDCPSNLACINQKCKDPCPGVCGDNTQCRVVGHNPVCSCKESYTGDPFRNCIPIQPVISEPPKTPIRTPCDPSPCGANAVCRDQNGAAVCQCLPEYFGDARQGCKPECVLNTDCASTQVCVNQKCRDPCPGLCGSNAECRVVNHFATCYCPQGYSGNPLESCRIIPVTVTRPTEPSVAEKCTPCSPSPCGPHSVCREVGCRPACSCQATYLGVPPSCRPECLLNSDCDSSLACINQKCKDPCAGICGQDAECRVVNHNPICSCPRGQTGDPFVQCRPTPVVRPPIEPQVTDPCVPSPCGPNSRCQVINDQATCGCLANMIGTAPNCRPECVVNSDCPSNRACVSQKCVDPCPGSCGFNADCRVASHQPVCSCQPKFTGDPYTSCRPIPVVAPPTEPSVSEPCNPSPCGPNSVCRPVGSEPVCSCQSGYEGVPPECRPECISSSECPPSKACVNQKCQDPCPGACGRDAQCRVVNHSPICVCPSGWTGDPVTGCRIIPTPTPNPVVEQGTLRPLPPNPCTPSPCGPNSQCQAVAGQAQCGCVAGMIGSAPNCRPECVVNSDCTSNKACINQKCQDPCPGTCATNAECRVVSHSPVCNCVTGYTGNAFSDCRPVPTVVEPNVLEPENPCDPNPCGDNARCETKGGVPNRAFSCVCPTNYVGDPYRSCRPECVLNSDCPRDKGCVNNRCVDPCPGTCGINADCRVTNHIPVCSCKASHTGDPYGSCRPIPVTQIPTSPSVIERPCVPTPCGPNSQCREVGSAPVCSCQPGYLGVPPECRPECASSAECAPSQACINFKCQDPCLGTCGRDADCRVVNHNPICNCPSGWTGDPLTGCSIIPTPVPTPVVEEGTLKPLPPHPCTPSPCGPNSQCQVVSGQAQCGCMPNMIGSAPNCRPECVLSSDCPSNQACINQRCVDPCPGTCASNADCRVVNHSPVCNCATGYTGDAFSNCRPIPAIVEPNVVQPPTPCDPNPCGTNAQCKHQNGAINCVCPTNYVGDPYSSCRPECVLNSDCPRDKGCVNNRCVDPCQGTCGINADCRVANHVPVCSCKELHTGDPYGSCRPIPAKPVTSPNVVERPCVPTPCGPNSQCREVGSAPVCSCQPGYLGVPPECRPECVSSSECAPSQACNNFKCQDPCPGTCGRDADCHVVNHNPICNCPSGWTGDPLTGCSIIPTPIPNPVVEEGTLRPLPPNPCSPTPCGPNSQCQVVSGQAQCGCMPNMIGTSPNCRPECVLGSDCPSSQACVNQKCVDPCPGTCANNADCRVVNHSPICSCAAGFTGNAFDQCRPVPVVGEPNVVQPPRPCDPNPCGTNAQCKEQNGAINCVCPSDYIGDPYSSCRPECVLSSDCPRDRTCSRNRCVDPCASACGPNSQCRVANHVPVCSCLQGFLGDPYSGCQPIPATSRPSEPVVAEKPCVPSPCGPNSQCREVGNVPACSCLSGYLGVPPDCRPECVTSSECAPSKACVNSKCQDPCLGTCGLNSECKVVNHNPVCTCPSGWTGDPFTQCQIIPIPLPSPVVEEGTLRPLPPNPCNPPPCGANSQCQVVGGQAQCACIAGMIGSAPNCRPECVISSDCPSKQACVNRKCRDPCPGTCGANAECRVVNHAPSCSCREGFTGNAFADCRPVPAVVEPSVVEPPKKGCNPSPCGVNAECRDISGSPECICPPNYLGDPYTSCRPECVLNTDCSRDRTCVRNRCENPCTDACGPNAECRVANHVPVCVCQPGFTGNPFSSCSPTPVVGEPGSIDRVDVCNPNPCGTNAECRPQGSDRNICVCLPGLLGDPYVACKPDCVTNSDCSNNMACVAQKCKDPCPGACGVNAQCQVVGHNPVCSCANGFVGDPFVRCQPRPAVIEPVVKPECEVDPDCQTTQACVEQRCVDPCLQRPGICAPNAECRVVQHRPVCVCAEGFTGNPQVQCIQVGCRSDSDCPSTEACVNRQCKDPCVFETCGTNALCKVNVHRPQCFCPERHEGDPYRACRLPECLVDEDCPSTLACREKNCRDPCNCPPNTKCTVINHLPKCSCPPGYKGEPNTTLGCFLPEEPAVVKGGCTSDGECPSKHACFNGECVNPCTVIKPCGLNAQCLVVDSLPLRTMTCQCLPGFFGNPNVECRSVPVEEPGCRADDDCPDNLSCRNRQCISPCKTANPCSNNAICTVVGHQPKCECPEGHTGNPNINCYQIPKVDVECRSDTDCPLDKACEQTVCQDPCVVRNPCGDNAVCRTQQHRPVCFCPDGWGGDPQHKCFRPECERDDDCPSDRACITGKCLNPCVFGGDQCGTNALCRVTLHRPQCYCPAGMQGNPTVICIPVGCQSHDDCATEEVCDRLNRVCVKVCETVACAPSATCTGQDHQAVCNCPPGQRGNPFVRCIEDIPIVTASPPRPECRSDPDCPSKEVCMNNKCVDPCGVKPCGDTGQLCSVVDSNPLRTVVCQCPPDSFADENSRCISAVTGETPRPVTGCTADDQCPSDEACRNGVCESPCNCAPESICRVVDRKPVCACREGLTGDPLVACYKVGCQADEECPGTHACVNGQCKHVCLPATCVSGSTCRGIQHKPICECPPGTSGNPNAGCRAIGCTNTNDCPTDRACFNGICTDPCSMPNACAVEQECKPFNHTAVCDCPPGFTGTPQTACTRVDMELGCRADTDCPSLEACINRECKDPCAALQPCAPSAVCEVKPTSPYRTMVCVCPPGTTGYAAIECVKVAVPEVEEECVLIPGQVKMPNGTCVCDPLRNLIMAPNGTCICDPDKGFVVGPSGVCVSPVLLPECVSNADCPDDKYCNATCRDPCADRVCYPNSECRAIEHKAVCACIRGHAFKDDVSGCVPEPPPFRTDFPRPDIVVNCLADGVQVDIHIGTAGFDGVLYVKGHSKDENCRRVLDAKRDIGSIDYKVRFDTCGLVLENGEASFILVIQKHPKLMTFKAQAYQVRCVYDTPEKTVTVGFNVSMLTTAGTISNTGPPPVCTMKICLPSGQEVRSAVIGDTLMLKVEVQPIGIYGGFARSCYAVTDNNNTHLVTDENGCPTDPTIFGAWTQNPETRTLVSSFNAFKFPASDNIRFQCNIRVCFGRCQPVNCDGIDAYGRRRRRQADTDLPNLTPRTTNLTEVEIRESVIAGQLREEIMVQSNSILALDRGGEERFSAPTEAPDVVRQEVCVSTMGFIIALIITALLALVAVAVAVSCWLMAYRRRPKIDGPLPHPAEFPNPLFTTPEPLAEPSPDYLS